MSDFGPDASDASDDIGASRRVAHRTWRDLPAAPPTGLLPAPAPEAEATAETWAWEPAPPAPPPPPPPSPGAARARRRRAVVAAAVVVALLLAGGGAWAFTRDEPAEEESATSDPAPDEATTETVPEGDPEPLEDVASALAPAVVQISAGPSVGSGFVYDGDGLVLTSAHVVAGADEVDVQTRDHGTLPGRVVGRDTERDLAVVSVDAPADLVAATLAEPGSVSVGQQAIAIGSPFGFDQSVTAGIVSALDRDLETPVGTLRGLIQTDAPINPGNSGGPLADRQARVIGVNTAIASASGGNDGVGFAVPIEDARSLLEQVEDGGGVDAPTVPDADGGSNPLLPGPGPSPFDPETVPELEDLLEELFGPDFRDFLDDMGVPEAAPGTGGLGIVAIPDPPPGIEEESSQLETTATPGDVRGTQTIVLESAEGGLEVVAHRGPDAEDRFRDIPGTATRVGPHDAVLSDDGERVIAWMPEPDLTVQVVADRSVPIATLRAVASAVEVLQ